MKKLLIIPAVLAITSLSGAALAFDNHHSGGTTWTNAFNTNNTSTVGQNIGHVSGGFYSSSTAQNNASVEQYGAAVQSGRNCLCKTNLNNAFNTTNTSTISQNISSVKWGGAGQNNATVFQAGASFSPVSP